MRGSIRWMAQNHVAANLLMMVFVVGGLVMLHHLKQEIFPEVSLDTILIRVLYPGASPEEVEEGIVIKVEEAITGIDGIKELKSQAHEGVGSVEAVLREDADPDVVLQDIKNAVDRITSFPEDAEEPLISKLINKREVVSVVIYGNIAEKPLREMAERIRDELLEYPNITQVELGGVRDYEITISVKDEALRKYNLTIEDIGRVISGASLDIPGGHIKTASGEVLVRLKGKKYHAKDYEDIVVLRGEDGGVLRLRDIAAIRDSFEDIDIMGRFNGMPAAMVKVFRVGDERPIDISNTVNAFVAMRNAAMPPDVRLSVWNDTSEYLKGRMRLLIKNACLGLILVFIVLGAFLEIGLAMWVMLGIPISFLGALFFMPAIGLSINMISLFAFIMALGIVVDDAIVVGENIYEKREKGLKRLDASISGAIEVGIPVIFSVLTTIIAFIPLLFIPGVMGKFMKVIPMVVITIFLISLIESLYVLPSHLAGGKAAGEKRGLLLWIEKMRWFVSYLLDKITHGPYKRLLKISLSFRYATCSMAIAALLIAIAIVNGGLIKFTFMPKVESDVIRVYIQMPVGTAFKETEKALKIVVEKGLETVKEFDARRTDGRTIMKGMYSLAGALIPRGGPVANASPHGSHLANVRLALEPYEIRGVSSNDVMKRWREKVGEIPGVEVLSFKANLVYVGANIDVQLAHEDPEMLQRVKQTLKDALRRYPGVYNIEDNYSAGKKEFKVRINERGELLGINEAMLGSQIRAAFYGKEALKLQRGRDELKVMVDFPEADRTSVYDMLNMRIMTPSGGMAPLSEVADIVEAQGYDTIYRYNRKRVIDVTASVDPKEGNADEIIAHLTETTLKDIVNDYPGLTYNLEGEAREKRESIDSMMTGFILALFGIYALLAVAFKSYFQPVIIMLAIPFGIVGALLGHIIMGFDLSILSMFGMVALSGVVVNDSLLLVDKINSERQAHKGGNNETIGMDGDNGKVKDQGGNAPVSYDNKADITLTINAMEFFVIKSATRRLRPILLTSLTTFFGLFPMILETSVQAQFLIPMAISLGFGILFATFITLFLIPCFYMILEDIRAIF